MSIYNIVHDVLWSIIGGFCGSAFGYVIVYKVIHPYIGIPYIKRRQKRNEQKQCEQLQNSSKGS